MNQFGSSHIRFAAAVAILAHLLQSAAFANPITVDFTSVRPRWGFLGLGGLLTGNEKDTIQVSNTGADKIENLSVQVKTFSWNENLQIPNWIQLESQTLTGIDLDGQQQTPKTTLTFARTAPKKLIATVFDSTGNQVATTTSTPTTRGLRVNVEATAGGKLDVSVGGKQSGTETAAPAEPLVLQLNAKAKVEVAPVMANIVDPQILLSLSQVLPQTNYENSEGFYDPSISREDALINFAPESWFTFDSTMVSSTPDGSTFVNLFITPTATGDFYFRVHGEETGQLPLDSLVMIRVVPEPATMIMVILGLSVMAALLLTRQSNS